MAQTWGTYGADMGTSNKDMGTYSRDTGTYSRDTKLVNRRLSRKIEKDQEKGKSHAISSQVVLAIERTQEKRDSIVYTFYAYAVFF